MVNLNGWDTVSVLNVQQVNAQLAKRLSELVITFKASWTDVFSGSYDVSGTFGPWAITGGSGSDIYLTLPIVSGTMTPQSTGATSTDITGMSVTVIVNLEWIPSAVTPQGMNLQFDLREVTAPGAVRQPGGISVMSVTDPHNTGFGAQVGRGIANTLLDSKDKITFIFAQTGIVDVAAATWLEPKQSTYSFHQPVGGDAQYLAILSVTGDQDISGLSSNIEDGIVSSQYPLAFAVSGDLFLASVILPALPGAFPNSSSGNFSYSAGTISLASQFNLNGVTVGLITYTPTVTAMTITINANAVNNHTEGSASLDLPNAYITFWATTNNVLTYNPADQTFTFLQDPNPQSGTDSHVPWYDYLIGLGGIGAAIIAIVLAAVESDVSSSLSGSHVAGSLANAPATSVRWQGLGQITIESGALNDCFIMLANVA